MLTREEAKELVLARLGAREGDRPCFRENGTIERPFGWLFVLTVPESHESGRSAPLPRRLVIVNKHASQVVGSSVDYTPERFVEVYEKLWARSLARGSAWCLTLSLPLPWKSMSRERLAEAANDLGLYEIR